MPFAAGDFGNLATALGDFDGDGYADYAISARNFDPTGMGGGLGRVYLYSGRSSALILSVDGIQAGANFGVSVADAGDLDGDGTRDLLVGAPDFDLPGIPNAGRVAAFSGVSGAEIWASVGTATGASRGFRVGVIGDGTPGGTATVVATEPGFSGALASSGRVVYLDPGTGALLDDEEGAFAFDSMGRELALRGGVGGAFAGSAAGRVFLLDGPGGAPTATLAIDVVPGAADTPSLALLASPPGAAYALLVGRRLADSGGVINNGRVSLHPNGSPVASLTITGLFQNENVGIQVIAVRDVDGDGVEEIGFSSTPIGPGVPANSGRFRIVTAAGSPVIDDLRTGTGIGTFASIPDVTGDDRGEWIMGIDNNLSLTFAAELFSLGLEEGSITSAGNLSIEYLLDFGPARAGRVYVQLYSLTGSTPGFVYAPGAPLVPLTVDATTNAVLGLAGSPIYPDAVGFLGPMGSATTHVEIPAPFVPFVSGLEIVTAVLVLDAPLAQVIAASNPIRQVFP